MIRIGWFSPISTQTGIAGYSRNVLEALVAAWPRDEVEVIVFHPPTDHVVEEMPCPVIELSDSLLKSDFGALFDIAIYHIGNNTLNHAAIYAALQRHPGLIVLHDYVYQHYVAGLTSKEGFIGSAFGALIHEQGGASAFEFLAESGVMKSDLGAVSYVPWEGEWSTTVPLGDVFARLGTGVLVHSAYARGGLGKSFSGEVLELFMPRPSDQPEPQPLPVPQGRIHIVCGGHIGSTKGLRLLTSVFMAHPRLRDRFKVTIAGFGSDEEFLKVLRREIQDPAISGVFELRVDPPDEDYDATMASADLFFNLRFPNTEGASLSLVEQLAFGRPVIAYRTGCFAEMPEDAGYFLSRIGDPDELAELLGRIAADPADLARRAPLAWEAVRGHDAGAYADRLVTFLQERMPVLRRRADLLAARKQGILPVPAPEDRRWFQDNLTARRQIQALSADRFFLPEGLLDESDEDVGRFVALNLLHSRVPRSDMQAIGRILHDLSPIEAATLIGKLVVLSEKSVHGRELLPNAIDGLFLPITDAAFWDILSALKPQQSVPLAALALGMTFRAEEIQYLIANSERSGFERVIAEMLRGRDNPRRPNPDFDRIATRLEARGSALVQSLRPLPAGADLLALLALPGEDEADLPEDEDDEDEIDGEDDEDRADDGEDGSEAPDERPDRTRAVLTGFHPPEPIGIWSRAPDATILLRAAAGVRVACLEGGLSLLKPPETGRQTVTVTVLEQQSGRTRQERVHFLPGVLPECSFRLDLPDFEGALRIRISTTPIRSPQEAGISPDPRPLGVLVRSLRLCAADGAEVGAPPEATAAAGPADTAEG